MKYIKKLKKHPLKSWVKGYGNIAMRDLSRYFLTSLFMLDFLT